MKIKSIIIIFFSWICCMLVGCKGTQPTQLPTPSNFKVVEKVLTWDVVENAEGVGNWVGWVPLHPTNVQHITKKNNIITLLIFINFSYRVF